MSRLEIIMLIAFGFTVASLACLFVGRIVLALSERRSRAQMAKARPGIISALEMERDRLKAQHAVAEARHAAAIDALKADIAMRTGAEGRLRTKTARLRSDLADAHHRIATLTAALDAARRELAVLKQAQSRQGLGASAASLRGKLPGEGSSAAPLPDAVPPGPPARSREDAESLFSRIEALIDMAHEIERQRITGELTSGDLVRRLNDVEAVASDLEDEVRGAAAPAPRRARAGGVTNLARRLRALNKPQS